MNQFKGSLIFFLALTIVMKIHKQCGMHVPVLIHIPYPRERGPMGGAPYIGPRLGGRPIFEVSVSRLYAKERPGKLLTLSS